jgi:hypothetical protein
MNLCKKYPIRLFNHSEASWKVKCELFRFVETITRFSIRALYMSTGCAIHCQKEKKTLESKRLDLDACKTKLKKQKESRTKSEVSLGNEKL